MLSPRLIKFGMWVHLLKMVYWVPEVVHDDLYFDLWPVLYKKQLSNAFLLKCMAWANQSWWPSKDGGSGKCPGGQVVSTPNYKMKSWGSEFEYCWLYGTSLHRGFHHYSSIISVWLTLVLLNPDIPCLCRQCRSRSVGFFRSQLIWICTVCH